MASKFKQDIVYYRRYVPDLETKKLLDRSRQLREEAEKLEQQIKNKLAYILQSERNIREW